MRKLAVLFCLLIVLPLVAPGQSDAAQPTYKLPVPPEQPIYMTQGNNAPGHNSSNGSQYAFDFATVGSKPFTIVAARAGRVIDIRQDSDTNCSNLNTRDDGQPLKGCWKEANFVVIDQGDGTAALYLHVAKDSVLVRAGQDVKQGQPLATAGNTGFSTKTHLHFQVEKLPTPSSTNKGWWWTQSVKISFSDKDVLAKNPDGVPTGAGNPYRSDNVIPSAQPIVPGGVWISPTANSTITGSSIRFAARAYPTNPGDPAIDYVNFTVWWPALGLKTSPWKIALVAKPPATGDLYQGDVDLKQLGAPTGQLWVSFDVYDKLENKNLAPNGERTITYQPPPPLKEVQYKNVSFSYDPSLATNATGETVLENTEMSPGQWIHPEHSRFHFEGYPAKREFPFDQPAVYVFPVDEYKQLDPRAPVDALTSLLAQRPDLKAIDPLYGFQDWDKMRDKYPDFPLHSDWPLDYGPMVFNAKMQYLDFKNGSGIRFLTAPGTDVQGAAPIKGDGLDYLFKGITSDGKYYIAAIFPVSAAQALTLSPPDERNYPLSDRYHQYFQDVAVYNSATAQKLDKLNNSDYTPNLDLLDQLVKSITIETPPPTPTLTPTITPVASPNEIAYISPERDLWIASTDGSNARRIVSGPVSRPVWSHDGNRIAYLRDVYPDLNVSLGGKDQGLCEQIEIVNADGTGRTVAIEPSHPQNLPDGRWFYFERVRWSPDDSALYFQWNNYSSMGKGVTRHEMATGVEQGIVWAQDFDVAKDGTIAFVYYNRNIEGNGNHLEVIENGGQNRSLLYEPNLGVFGPTWSPDSAYIAVSSTNSSGWGFDPPGTLRIVSRDGSKNEVIMDNVLEVTTWSPDGTSLAFARPESGENKTYIWTIAVTGGPPLKRFPGIEPAWRPH